jgi:NAD-dependent SIR2 family protein deacetylase
MYSVSLFVAFLEWPQSPGTGLYSQLAKYNLPAPEAVFDIEFFRANPKPFNMLAKELFPGQYAPTPAHYMIKVLADRGWLLRCYTQNIDGLERVAGVDPGTVCVYERACEGFIGEHSRLCYII